MGLRLVCTVAMLVVGCGRLRFEPATGDGGSDPSGDGASLGDALSSHNVAFLSSTTIAGAGTLGGLAGADAICQADADAGGLTGSYVAWLSTTSIDAIDRVAGSRGWLRADGLPFADTVADLAAGRVLSPLEVLPDRSHEVGMRVVTGSTSQGTVATTNCDDYVATAGNAVAGVPQAIGVEWTATPFPITCSQDIRMYCFGVGHTEPVSPSVVSGRRAFVSTWWGPTGGLAGADAHCQTDADNVGLGATFRALVSTGNASAASRFADGLPWVRVDGMALSPTAQALLGGDIQVPPLLADGTWPDNFDVAWFGAPSFSVNGPVTCSNWTSNAAGQNGYVRDAWISYTNVGNSPCNATHPLLCLEP